MSFWLVPLLPPLVLASAPLQEGSADEVSAELEKERALVARVLMVHVDQDVEDQQRAYGSLQPAPLVTFVDVLAEGRVPAAWCEELETDLALRADARTALHGALVEVGLAELRPFFETLAADEPRLDRREVCVTILGEVGERRDLALVLGLATPPDEETKVLPRTLRKSYEEAVVRLIVENPSGLTYLQGKFDGLHPGLWSASVDAMAGTASPEALSALIALLGRVPELDAYVLAAVAKVGAEVPHPVAESGHAALCRIASEVAADLIVVGNRGMTGIGRFLGSVPNAVAHQAPCSVLIVDTD